MKQKTCLKLNNFDGSVCLVTRALSCNWYGMQFCKEVALPVISGYMVIAMVMKLVPGLWMVGQLNMTWLGICSLAIIIKTGPMVCTCLYA